MPSVSLFQKIGGFFGMSILTITLGYFFLLKVKVEQLAVLQTKESILLQKWKKKQDQTLQLPVYSKGLLSLQQHFDGLLKSLPSTDEMPALLEELSKIGIVCGLQWDLFAPQSELKQDFYVELPIKMIVEGEYRQLALFFTHVEKMSRMLSIDYMEVERLPAKRQSLTAHGLLIHMMATIYRRSY